MENFHKVECEERMLEDTLLNSRFSYKPINIYNFSLTDSVRTRLCLQVWLQSFSFTVNLILDTCKSFCGFQSESKMTTVSAVDN